MQVKKEREKVKENTKIEESDDENKSDPEMDEPLKNLSISEEGEEEKNVKVKWGIIWDRSILDWWLILRKG